MAVLCVYRVYAEKMKRNEVWDYKAKSYGDFRGRYDIIRECHTELLYMSYSSKRYNIPRLCHTDEGRIGWTKLGMTFFLESHAALKRLTNDATADMAFYKNVIPSLKTDLKKIYILWFLINKKQ